MLPIRINEIVNNPKFTLFQFAQTSVLPILAFYCFGFYRI
nr:MAG TPA: hypothetical protein [Bacteriophage sp.]